MKKTVLVLVLLGILLFDSTEFCKANDETPCLFENGKTWVCAVVYRDVVEYDTYKIDGDTVIDETTYYKLYRNDTFLEAVREEGKRCEVENGLLLYDFNLHKGETTMVFSPIPWIIYDVKVVEEDSIVLYGNRYRYMKMLMEERHDLGAKPFNLRNQSVTNNTTDTVEEYWIEGIGSLSGLVYPIRDKQRDSKGWLERCYIGQRVLFDRNEWTSKIPSVKKREATTYTYDLQGRKLSNSKWSNGQIRKGIYVKDGRKFVVK
ncbi:MAG: hypothetical protein IKQ03_02125 [Prevotella sp.]|nr:hypothetical protein [Prevotella sp.]